MEQYWPEPPPTPGQRRRSAGLGTFAGVFTPSILTILGIILFLRTGYVVGNAGLAKALVILAIATAVSVLTSLSLAAIATNMEVKGGGDYYLISRTLGLEFGGAIGVVLFLAQSVSVAFYAIGFGEVVASVTGWDSGVAVQLIAVLAILGLFVLAWAGADVATRFQFVIMAVLVAALLSFYAGAISSFDASRLSLSWASPVGAVGFWAVFAIFFPAVTGFTQGVSMSGDLADPGRSLPRGTFAAVGLSTVVYVTVMILLAATVPLILLSDDGGAAMRGVAVVGFAVTLGVIAATLSSAMASLLGAPRILQSLASDRVFPGLVFFARGHGAADNPRRAIAASLVIAIATVGLGSLNVIAPVVSMFFLMSYGLLNYATYYEARAASPSFRPRFRWFDKRLSLSGALLCVGAMLAINPLASFVAVIVLFALYEYLARRDVPARWTDASHSHHFARAVESIKALDREVAHDRHWRPQILVFSADASRRGRLLTLASWLEGGSGFTAAFSIVEGEGPLMRREAADRQQSLQAEIDALGLDIPARSVLAQNAMDALPVVVQSFGLGPLRSNTVLFGWPESQEPDRRATFTRAVRDVSRLGVNVVSASSHDGAWRAMQRIHAKHRRIDVWWDGDASSRLALLVAYLATRTSDWSRATIRLVAPIASDRATDDVVASLEVMLVGARISAEVYPVDRPSRRQLIDACQNTTLLLMPMRVRDEVLLDPFGGDMTELVRHLPMTGGVLAVADIDLLATPESGGVGALARAEEAAEMAEQRYLTLRGQVEHAEEAVARLRGDGGTGEEVTTAEADLERVRRRALSAWARLEQARRELDERLERGGGS
jgi:amino acid transporter